MTRDAKKLGLNLIAVSTYRSYDYQDKLFNKYVKEKGIDYASMCSARSGHSEHQLGLAVDIANDNLDYDNFDKTKESNWVKNNAYKYGFILRYPLDLHRYEPEGSQIKRCCLHEYRLPHPHQQDLQLYNELQPLSWSQKENQEKFGSYRYQN